MRGGITIIRVILCDDNRPILDYYQALLYKTAAEHDIELKIVCLESGEQLLFSLSDDPNSVDVIYLDILMGRMNGTQTAKKLRDIGCTAQIIYLTTSNEYVFEAFDVAPYYYIVKDEMPVKKFQEIFLKVIALVRQRADDFISISMGAATSKVPLDKILYFEIHNRLVTCHVNDSQLDFYASLDDLESALDSKGFIRTHRSYLVNCHHIKKLLRTQLLMSDDTELPIGNKFSHNVQTEFSKYLLQI